MPTHIYIKARGTIPPIEPELEIEEDATIESLPLLSYHFAPIPPHSCALVQGGYQWDGVGGGLVELLVSATKRQNPNHKVNGAPPTLRLRGKTCTTGKVKRWQVYWATQNDTRTTGERGQGAVSEGRAVKDAKGDVKDVAVVHLGPHTGAFYRWVQLKLKYRGGV